MAARKETDLIVCTSCSMYGTKDRFTDESCDKCKKCELICQMKEEKMAAFEREKEVECARLHMSALEVGAGNLDGACAAPKKERRSSAQLKPGEEPQLIGKDDIDTTIQQVISIDQQHFFVGIHPVKKETGKGVLALYECEGRIEGQNGVMSKPNHPVDKKAKDEKQLKLVKSYYTQPLSAATSLKIYKSLKFDYFKNRLCLNDDAEDPTLEANKAILYLRLYDAQ